MVLVLVAAPFPEAPARFQPRRPLEPPDWWLVKEPRDERGGAPADGVPGSLSDPCSDSPDDSPNRTHWRDGPTHQEWPQEKVRLRAGPQAGTYTNG